MVEMVLGTILMTIILKRNQNTEAPNCLSYLYLIEFLRTSKLKAKLPKTQLLFALKWCVKIVDCTYSGRKPFQRLYNPIDVFHVPQATPL